MAGKGNTVTRVRELAEPVAQQLGLDIWDIRFVKEGTDWYLRFFIDKDGGVSIDDCVDFTHAVTKPLDEADPISQHYTLEVSSPGIERELVTEEHFKKFIGDKVMVRLIRPVDNVRDFAGVLKSYEAGEITVELEDGSPLVFSKKEASYVKLDDFDINDFNKDI
jgi:ribosome maturation factor RimP